MNKKNISLILLISYLYIPSLYKVLLGKESLFYGFAVCSVISLLYVLFRYRDFEKCNFFLNKKRFNISLALIIFYQFVIVSDFNVKSFLSLFSIFIIVIVVSLLICLYEYDLLNIESAKSDFKKVCILQLIIFFLGLFGISSFGSYHYEVYPVMPYSEPSHFILFSSFVVVFFQTFYRGFQAVLFAVVAFIIGLSFPSLSAIVFSFILIFSGKFNSKLWLTCLSTGTIILSPMLLFLTDLDYFYERVTYDEYKNNLSQLVYYQGWDVAFNTFIETYGVGVGFQNMGTVITSNLSFLIQDITGGIILNRYDGGFLASKLITEFGILGIVFILTYLLYVYRVILFDEFYSFDLISRMKYSIVLCSLLDVFVRGIGYFSLNLILILSLSLISKRRFLRNEE